MCREGGSQAPIMVNRTFANRYLNGTAAIGHILSVQGNAFIPAGQVRGIVGDARETGLDREAPPIVYWCGVGLQPGTFFLARTHGEPAAMIAAVRRKIHELEPQRSVYD